jgi:hypothetical protein
MFTTRKGTLYGCEIMGLMNKQTFHGSGAEQCFGIAHRVDIDKKAEWLWIGLINYEISRYVAAKCMSRLIIIESATCTRCGCPIDRATSPEGAAICEDCYYGEE